MSEKRRKLPRMCETCAHAYSPFIPQLTVYCAARRILLLGKGHFCLYWRARSTCTNEDLEKGELA